MLTEQQFALAKELGLNPLFYVKGGGHHGGPFPLVHLADPALARDLSRITAQLKGTWNGFIDHEQYWVCSLELQSRGFARAKGITASAAFDAFLDVYTAVQLKKAAVV